MAIIEEHWKGNITHAQATVQIFGVLPDDTFSTEAFTFYVEQLSRTDRELLIASGHRSNVPNISLVGSPSGVVIPTTGVDAGEHSIRSQPTPSNQKCSAEQAFGSAGEDRTRAFPDESMYP